MSADKFDKELKQLYQQRKSQFTAPAVNIHPAKVAKTTETKAELVKPTLVKTKLSLASMLAITCTASIASFGIFVIIDHLIEQPKITVEQHNTVQTIDIEQIPLSSNSDETLAQNNTLKNQPAKIPPTNTLLVKSKKPTSVSAINNIKEPQQPLVSFTTPKLSDGLTLGLSGMSYQVISVPQLQQPDAAVKPIYKVLPKYHANAIKQQQTGAITLRYQIDNNSGEVKNISVVSSSVSNVLKKSAKKALSNWQYQGGKEYLEYYQVTFEFKLSNDP